ncbi:GLPGLI family protein [Chryseobacterium sp. 52]|uniref:GLPGLI family protein n=1 Tax=Chryseobacterium sp. 52 TaxID=2035213 RepID=UPI000C18BB4A|nr:GLPGLI family protein [Chryseobacterium sp. 52]PIF46185.1 GLPGLI family protein [Chryseobacterium sp. 52]
MNKYIFLPFILFFEIVCAQKQIHIQYLNVRSPIANVKEDLYSNGKNVISKQDGNFIWTDPEFSKKRKGLDFYFISNIDGTQNDRDFFFNSFVKDNAEDYYFVHDKVPHIEWKIDENSTKKILDYECTKATAVFRGSSITAYFTKEIPYPIGPFKFFGLPGAILDVRVNNKNYDLWKAVKVDLNNNVKINYQPEFSAYKKMNMKDFIILKDEANRNYGKDVVVPAGTTVKSLGGRFGVEKTFEWEIPPTQ